MNELSELMVEVSTTTRPALRERVHEMSRLQGEVTAFLETEVFRFLDAMPTPSQEAATRLWEAGGKRIRPTLSLLVAGACGGDWSDAKAIAVAVELLHTGSLLHDDVIDGSDLRRGISTAHTQWDNSIAILTGDFCFFAAIESLLALRDVETMEAAIRVSRDLAHGELLQRHRILFGMGTEHTEEGCLLVMQRKTACLFEFAALGAARAVGAMPDMVAAASAFGSNLGMAFQIVDDLLDISGAGGELGKDAGQDLAAGLTTLPLVYGEEAAPGLLQKVERGDLAGAELTKILADCGAIERCARLSVHYTHNALEALSALQAGRERSILEAVASGLLARRA